MLNLVFFIACYLFVGYGIYCNSIGIIFVSSLASSIILGLAAATDFVALGHFSIFALVGMTVLFSILALIIMAVALWLFMLPMIFDEGRNKITTLIWLLMGLGTFIAMNLYNVGNTVGNFGMFLMYQLGGLIIFGSLVVIIRFQLKKEN